MLNFRGVTAKAPENQWLEDEFRYGLFSGAKNVRESGPPGNDHISPPKKALLSRGFSELTVWWDMFSRFLQGNKTHRIHVWYIYLHLVDFYGK